MSVPQSQTTHTHEHRHCLVENGVTKIRFKSFKTKCAAEYKLRIHLSKHVHPVKKKTKMNCNAQSPNCGWMEWTKHYRMAGPKRWSMDYKSWRERDILS